MLTIENSTYQTLFRADIILLGNLLLNRYYSSRIRLEAGWSIFDWTTSFTAESIVILNFTPSQLVRLNTNFVNAMLTM